jgi:hypothetical protein
MPDAPDAMLLDHARAFDLSHPRTGYTLLCDLQADTRPRVPRDAAGRRRKSDIVAWFREAPLPPGMHHARIEPIFVLPSELPVATGSNIVAVEVLWSKGSAVGDEADAWPELVSRLRRATGTPRRYMGDGMEWSADGTPDLPKFVSASWSAANATYERSFDLAALNEAQVRVFARQRFPIDTSQVFSAEHAATSISKWQHHTPNDGVQNSGLTFDGWWTASLYPVGVAVRSTMQTHEKGNEPDEWRPIGFFPSKMVDRIKKAAGPKRKTKRVRSERVDGVVLYNAADVRRWWPDEGES